MTFFSPQLDYSKKLLKTKFTFRAEAYVWEYLIAIKSTNENKYEMLITKIRSFFSVILTTISIGKCDQWKE